MKTKCAFLWNSIIYAKTVILLNDCEYSNTRNLVCRMHYFISVKDMILRFNLWRVLGKNLLLGTYLLKQCQDPSSEGYCYPAQRLWTANIDGESRVWILETFQTLFHRFQEKMFDVVQPSTFEEEQAAGILTLLIKIEAPV